MKSMTGYGQAQGEVEGRLLSVEVRCTNHRYCDVRVQAGPGWTELEFRLEQKLRAWLQRGRADCWLRGAGGAALAGSPLLDEQCAREYLQVYQKLARLVWGETGLEYQPGLELLASSGGVVTLQEGPRDAQTAWIQLEAIVEQALHQADAMRLQEGEHLKRELRARLESMELLRGRLEQLLPGESEKVIQKARERMQSLLAGVEPDAVRLEQEIVFLAERSDVREEMVRLASHLQQLDELLGEEGALGKRLDFLLQEMMRESNTMCAKLRSAELVKLAVELKTEIERAREQAQNVL